MEYVIYLHPHTYITYLHTHTTVSLFRFAVFCLHVSLSVSHVCSLSLILSFSLFLSLSLSLSLSPPSPPPSSRLPPFVCCGAYDEGRLTLRSSFVCVCVCVRVRVCVCVCVLYSAILDPKCCLLRALPTRPGCTPYNTLPSDYGHAGAVGRGHAQDLRSPVWRCVLRERERAREREGGRK